MKVRIRPGRRLYIAITFCVAAGGLAAWLVAGVADTKPDLWISSRVSRGDLQKLAQRVPVFPGSTAIGYRDLGANHSGSQCHGRSAQVTLRGRMDVVWDVTQWYDRTLPRHGWRIFGGVDARNGASGSESFVEHGYITDRQSVGVWLPADVHGHAVHDSKGLTTWRIDYEVMDGDAQTVAWCAFAQIGPLGA